MIKILMFMASILNKIHHLILKLTDALGLELTDKQMHFWLLGIIGIILFMVLDVVFKKVAKWSISALTFIYTFTIIVVFVLGIEIEQKVMRAGNMEFADIIAGLGGFFAFFILYMVIRLIVSRLKTRTKKR